MDSCPEFSKDLHMIKADQSCSFTVADISLPESRGITYCHCHMVLHHDLKSQILLTDRHTNSLMLVDFGLPRAFGIHVRTFTYEEIGLDNEAIVEKKDEYADNVEPVSKNKSKKMKKKKGKESYSNVAKAQITLDETLEAFSVDANSKQEMFEETKAHSDSAK
ncbi:uncharacterized protein LOC18012619 isoform X2 [Eutrema salsugineum]|nr:uncharacterized protein LOC18012619 isoform X2 [Eutrema salsugineum]